MDMEKCIEIQNLQKSFGAIHAVNNLSLQVETGQLFAFLGVNGAGKKHYDLHDMRSAPGRTSVRSM